MKISVYILLQSLLFSSICCRFSEAENEKFDAAHQHNTHYTTPQFQYARSGPEINRDTAREHLSTNSSKANFPCPDSAVIAPCTCTVDSDNKITIDCTLVESVDQLVEVFKQDFPVKELYKFEMSRNNEVDFFPNFMNGVTFENIYLSPGDFILLAISDLFLIDLIDTLQDMHIYYSKLTTDFFPFYILPLMNHLDTLIIYDSEITSIPPIISPALSTFGIVYSPIELLSNGTFPIGAGPVTLNLYGNQINTIELGSFFFVDQSSTDPRGRPGPSAHSVCGEERGEPIGDHEPPQPPSGSSERVSRRRPEVPDRCDAQVSSNSVQATAALHQMREPPAPTHTIDKVGIDSNEQITISLYSNQLQSLKAGTFPMRNGPIVFYLSSNQISSIEPGTFVLPTSTGIDSNEPITISLHSNQLQSLKAGTFPMRNGPMVFYLSSNQISSIEPGTFVLPTSTDMLSIILSLHDNELTYVDEQVFLDLMPFITEILLYGNPLACDCDMAWLIVNSDFMEKVDDDATCADGTNLNDLDPQQFIDSC